MEATALCLVGGVIIVGIAILASVIKIVPEYHRLVVFRMGRCVGEKGPGIIILVPFVDRAVRVDLREQVREIPHQTVITQDNASIAVDFLWYYKVLSPTESVLNVGDFERAAKGIATTTLRAVVGGISLDQVLSDREHINSMLRVRLDDVTERWGVKVTNVEISEILPPREIQESMNRQMTAERVRRAVVTESLGTKEAEITVAEGKKAAAVLEAEGLKAAAILESEGQKAAQELKAEGYAAALENIFNSASKVDQNTMILQYFDTLKEMGQGESTKYIFPMEFTSMLKSFIDKNE
ncbi:MAG TPA: SPFH/Band 7/PHB domain protein [Anaerolineales bacterium]|nr:SPFH/Band 7/PHB domain protein [Anaerolineales bacterium]